jgi:hypothetical protein
VARTLITPKRVTLSSYVWTTADLVTPDVANGNYAINDGMTFLYLVSDGSTRTVTVTTPVTVNGFAVADDPISIAANSFGQYGPFPVAAFGPQLLLDFSNTALKCLLLSYLPEVRS